MIDQVLEGQQKMGADFNGKLDVVYTELNSKFEALNTHVKSFKRRLSNPMKLGRNKKSW